MLNLAQTEPVGDSPLAAERHDVSRTLRMMDDNVNAESVISHRLRRTAGVTSLLGLAVAALGAMAGYENLASFGFLVFVILPWAIMIPHLAFTRCMTKDDKVRWRHELPWSFRSFVAVWAYLFSTDLKARTRGFGSYRS